MSFRIDDEKLLDKYKAIWTKDVKLLEKYKAIWTKIKDLKNIESSALPAHDDRYIKTKIRAYGDNVYPNFRGLNVPEDDKECDSFIVISVDSLLV